MITRATLIIYLAVMLIVGLFLFGSDAQSQTTCVYGPGGKIICPSIGTTCFYDPEFGTMQCW